jgi:hypothetical protein
MALLASLSLTLASSSPFSAKQNNKPNWKYVELMSRLSDKAMRQYFNISSPPRLPARFNGVDDE